MAFRQSFFLAVHSQSHQSQNPCRDELAHRQSHLVRAEIH